jgi:site-specific recombinase XerD
MGNDEIITLWLESQRSEHTREAYDADILKLCDFLKDKPFPDVQLRDLQRHQRYLEKAKTKHGRKYAEKTKQRLLIAVKSLFSFASEEGLIGANPAKRLALPKCKDNRGARVLERAEIGKMLAVTTKRRDYLILKTCFSPACGCWS